MTHQRGAVSTELAVITPVIIGFMLLVVFAGRVAHIEGDIANAAHEAARAASLTRDPETATKASHDTATANLEDTDVTCRTATITTDTTQFVPGGQVTVTVTCTTSFADIAMLSVPATRTFTATATEVIDTYRTSPETNR